MKKVITILTLILAIDSCSWIGNEDATDHTDTAAKPQASSIPTPVFDAKLAYELVSKQVSFGPRVPSTPAHKACAEWILSQLKKTTDTAYFQTFEAKTYDQKKHKGYNIIAKINPQLTNRVMLSAHWDTRHVADQDPQNPLSPILGANDGGSGVGVILALAASIQSQRPNLGIDIVLFDLEDYGQPENSGLPEMKHSYCLGSQYWAANPTNDHPIKYGVLLDMVGGLNASFPYEGNSMYSAPALVTHIWDIADDLGYSSLFKKSYGPSITDDHYYVSSIARIPMIDIIHLEPSSQKTFAHYWHTHLDNMNSVDQNSLKAVGEVLIKWLYIEAQSTP